ncbi:MAG: TetR/AcrR family transcriptional regulator [Woeseiaceae bacterium]|nr:TetR/AcrR family transcriptional regulator [Woeseiaceae bacterium]
MAKRSTKASGPGEQGWQAQKSAATRDQILGAAVRCIVELGYSRTTTMKIAERAGLSRGATLHHFPSKLDIIRAAVDYLHEKRLRAFRNSVTSIPEGTDRIKAATEAYWQHATHPIFVAFFELSVAARTDKELEAILRPAQTAFDEEWYKTAQELFPEWQSDKEAFDLALSLVQHLMEGIAVSYMTHPRQHNLDRLREYLEDRLRELAPEEIR